MAWPWQFEPAGDQHILAANMTVLDTPRLTLRRVTLEDAAFVLEVLNDPGYIRFIADRGVRTVEDAASYIAEKCLPSFEQHGFGFCVVELKRDGTPIGMCGLMKRETLEDVDIGYSLLERFWGNGYAVEAAAAVMDYARRVLGLPRVVGITAIDNVSSAKVLEKIGLRYEKMIHVPGYEGESRLFT